jgi:hypothetical protein
MMIETDHSISPLSPQFRASISMAVRLLAQRSAVEIVKHQLRARGLKVYSFAHEIVALAHDYIAAHAELIAEATVTVEERRPEGFFGKRVVRTGHILVQSATTPPRSGEIPSRPSSTIATVTVISSLAS